MKKSIKVAVGVGAGILVVAALIFSNTDLMKGSLQNIAATYKNASWKCYDGTSKNASGSICKPSSFWSNKATSYCKGKCKSGKCGVNSFSVSNKCLNPGCLSQEDRLAQPQAADQSWMGRLSQLAFADFQCTTDSTGNLIFTTDGGHFKFTQPDLEGRNNEEEYFAKFHLSQLKLCSNAIQEQIGREPYRGQVIAGKVIINPDSRRSFSACCDFSTDHAMEGILRSDVEFETSVFSEHADWKGDFINYNVCLGGHEELHRFLNGTNIHNWANEGLATRIEQRQSGSGSLIECLPDRFRALSAEGPGEVTIPFRNLSTEWWNAPVIYSYYTAACFWDHVAKTYGEGKISEIINALYAAAPLRQDSDFINNILVPILGNDILEYLGRMGITP